LRILGKKHKIGLAFLYRAVVDYDMDELLAIMVTLRSDSGCPWDREQTHASIRANVLEEAYEVAEAIDRGDPAMLCEELGDLLLQVVFHAQMASEAGDFDFKDVAEGICRKLTERHPHIFGDVKVDGSEQVLANWDAIKRKSKGHDTLRDTLNGVAKSLPALTKAEKMAGKIQKAGQTVDASGTDIGSRLLAIAVEARALGIDPEEALQRKCAELIELAIDN